MKLIAPTMPAAVKKVYATVLDMSGSDIRQADDRIREALRGVDRAGSFVGAVNPMGANCFGLFKEYGRLIQD